MTTKLPRVSLLRFVAFVACAGMLSTPSLHAQAGPPPSQQNGQGGNRGPANGGPGMQQRQLERMTSELSLTSDQVTQIKAIQADGRAQAMALRETEQTKTKAVLTDPQKVKFDAMMEKMKGQRGRRPRGSVPPPPPPPPSN